MNIKHIEKAIEELGYEWNNPNGYELKSEKDLKSFEIFLKDRLLQAEMEISDWQEEKEKILKNIEVLEAIKHQALVEEYKELNPDKEVF